MRKFLAKMSVLLASMMLVCVSLTGCGGMFGGGSNSEPAPKEYTIQYSDDAGTHTLTVTEGMPYSLESVPYRYGYEFLGLYDAQTGGTQYVGANGASLAPYKDKENKVLFPQFKPVDYTVILDYGNATVTGERSLTVAYNEALPELPNNLTLAHNEFTGWYTEAGGKGTQIADAYGNLPVVSVLNEENFKLNDSKRVYLYAGFELEKYTVTFIFDDGIPSEEMEVPYNTPISQVVPTTRNSEKQAGLIWSESRGGDTFTGNITDDMELYVKEWAPVIELNGNGADVTPIVARAGTIISLPSPTKPLAKFLRWEDENGQTKDITTMPNTSTTLNAVWQAKIEFDENGGTDVDDISKPAGESIALPTPTKEGYLFAGWYTADKEQYAAKTMPSAGIALKAGWYKAETVTEILKKDSTDSKDWATSGWFGVESAGPKSSWRLELDMAKYGNLVQKTLSITLYVDMKLENTFYSWEAGFYLYNDSAVSSANFVTKLVSNVTSDSWKTYQFTDTIYLQNDIIYLCYYCKKLNWDDPSAFGGYGQIYYKNIYIEITYPDTTYLYL